MPTGSVTFCIEARLDLPDCAPIWQRAFVPRPIPLHPAVLRHMTHTSDTCPKTSRTGVHRVPRLPHRPTGATLTYPEFSRLDRSDNFSGEKPMLISAVQSQSPTCIGRRDRARAPAGVGITKLSMARAYDYSLGEEFPDSSESCYSHDAVVFDFPDCRSMPANGCRRYGRSPPGARR